MEAKYSRLIRASIPLFAVAADIRHHQIASKIGRRFKEKALAIARAFLNCPYSYSSEVIFLLGFAVKTAFQREETDGIDQSAMIVTLPPIVKLPALSVPLLMLMLAPSRIRLLIGVFALSKPPSTAF